MVHILKTEDNWDYYLNFSIPSYLQGNNLSVEEKENFKRAQFIYTAPLLTVLTLKLVLAWDDSSLLPKKPH